MRWEDFRRSDNVEDRRGEGGGFGGGGGMPMRTGGLGIGTIVVLGLVGWALGIDPRVLIGGAEVITGGRPSAPYQQGPRPDPSRPRTARPNDQARQFVSAILGDTEDRWTEIFQKRGDRYVAPRLVMFSGAIASACGQAQSAMGPFYCPGDKKIYLDTSFFRDLERRFQGCSGKACQFSQAYVIAHEVGHHVQNLTDILPKVQRAQRGKDRREGNALQVRVELQADCFAGIWAFHSNKAKNMIEPGDIEAALQTASAIGDDRLQKQAQGRVVPDAFTHGSSEQRVRWFKAGLTSGNPSSCNTFGDAGL